VLLAHHARLECLWSCVQLKKNSLFWFSSHFQKRAWWFSVLNK
jgi:hypothetical protein